jgi:hypothetical protein
VRWLFDRFRGGARRRAGIVCYLRENGPIAYTLPLFGDNPRERFDAMFETGLGWYWSTQRAGGAPAATEWTELTRWSMAALLADLAGAVAGRRMVLVGIDPSDARVDLSKDVGTWMRRFASDERGPLHVLIQRVDGEPDHVFVAQQPPENVRTLLQAWGIDRARADRRAYPRLRERSLESLMESLRR